MKSHGSNTGVSENLAKFVLHEVKVDYKQKTSPELDNGIECVFECKRDPDSIMLFSLFWCQVCPLEGRSARKRRQREEKSQHAFWD